MPLTRISELDNNPDVPGLFDLATTISTIYDDYVESDLRDGVTRAPGIHASEISSCARKIVYSVRSEPKKTELKKTWRQRFEVGKAIHLMIQNDFYALASKSNGRIHFEAEVPIHPDLQKIANELNLHSSCDGVITFFDSSGQQELRVGLEIKTEAPDGYEKLTAPKAQHIEQAHVYMKALDLPLFYFFYMNKGNQNNTPSLAPYLLRYNPRIWENIEARCRYVLEIAKTDELPDREEGVHCMFCPYAHACQPKFLQPKNVSSVRWKQPRGQ